MLERPVEARAAFVAEACGDDAELSGEIMSRLEVHSLEAPLTDPVDMESNIFDRLASALVALQGRARAWQWWYGDGIPR